MGIIRRLSDSQRPTEHAELLTWEEPFDGEFSTECGEVNPLPPSCLNCNSSIVLACVFLFLAASPCELPAAVWTVEVDGTGDFDVIHDAVSAAAPGDTLLLGPGRFDEVRSIEFGAGTFLDVYAGITKDNLTIIGSQQAPTTVGPTVPGTNEYGFVAYTEGTSSVRVERVWFENVNIGFMIDGMVAEVSEIHCDRISAVGLSFLSSVGSRVVNSTFRECEFAIGANWASSELTVDTCSFSECTSPLTFDAASKDFVVENVTIVQSRSGIVAASLSTGTIRDSSIDTDFGAAVGVSGGSEVELVNNVIRSTDASLRVSSIGSVASGYGNVFHGGETAVLVFSSYALSGLSGNDLSKGTGPSVVLSNYALGPAIVDLTDNYWGTTSRDSIETWIIDSHDLDDPPLFPHNGTVLFEPIREQSIPTTKRSFGSLKAIFGG